MFKPIDGSGARVVIELEGQPVAAREGVSLAIALLEAGVDTFRFTPVSGQPRAPLCLMGACFDCLIQVDGQDNVQACMVAVREGMRVRRQRGARALEAGA